mgnify:CR=1 FL=1
MTVAVVGLGSIGRRHVRVITTHFPEVNILSVRRKESTPVPEDQMVSKRLISIQAAIEHGLDAAVLAGPAPQRLGYATAFLRAGIPLLLEKPVVATDADAQELLGIEDGNSAAYRRSLVGYVLRHQNAFSFLQQQMSSASLGELRNVRVDVRTFLPDWRPGQDYKQTVSARKELGGGVMRELSHEFDYLTALAGEFDAAIGWRNAHSAIGIDTEEHVEVLLKTENSVPVSLSLDFATRAPRMRRFTAVFSRGEILWDVATGRVRVTSANSDEIDRHFDVERDEMFRAQFAHFLNCINGSEAPVCTIHDGISTLRAITASERSFESGRWEKVA